MYPEKIYLAADVRNSSLFLIEDVLDKIKTNRSFLKKKEESFHVNTIYQYAFGYKPLEPLQTMVYQIILSYLLKTEKYSPGNIVYFLEKLKAHMQYLPSSSLDSEDETLISYRSSLEDLKKLWTSLPVSNSIVDLNLIEEIINLTGFGGKVILEKSNSDIESIELTRGYTFYLTPSWKISTTFKNPKVVLIDGFLESVSEIHHLLEKFHEEKESGLIFCRGMSPDVLNTLRVNWERGNLKLLPVTVSFDLEGINTLNDLAAVVGCDVISSNKGNLISSINWADIKSVSDIDVSDGKIAIRNDSTYLNVCNHLSYLKARRESSENVVDVTSLYDRRIRSLTPNHVIVKLKDDVFFVSRSQSIDLALRSIKSLVDFGVTDAGELTSLEISRIYAKKCADTLNGIGAAMFHA